MVIPDSSKRLSDGLVIETAVVARLLGVKLLTLEGTVLASPAQLKEFGARAPSVGPAAASPAASSPAASSPAASSQVVTPPARRRAPTALSAPSPREPYGTQLMLAAGLLRDSADELQLLRDTEEGTARTNGR
jgi:hypothetical protein